MLEFETRTKKFMEWFEKNHVSIERKIAKNDFSDVNAKLKEQLNKVLPGVAFRLSKIRKEETYILEFNTQLIPTVKAAAIAFCRMLPEDLSGTWKFCWSHPACKGTAEVSGKVFDSSDVKVIPQFDDRRKKVTLLIEKTDKLAELSNEEVFTVIYMLLSDYLGETAVDAYIGTTQFLRGLSKFKYRNEHAYTMNEFSQVFRREIKERGWQDPDQILMQSSDYQAKTKSYEIRMDMTQGRTLCPDLLKEEGLPEKARHEFLKHCSIGLYSAVTDLAPDMSKDERARARISIEKDVRAILDMKNKGMVINSAMGNAHCYADFLVYSDEALEEVRKMAAQYDDCRIINLQKDNYDPD